MTNKFFFKTHKGLTIISLVYLLSFLFMLPLRDQAFDDDFAYIRTVERLVETGELKISEWAATSLVFQVYWGALFSKIFGFSIRILHLSNFVLFYIGGLFFYQLLKRLGLNEVKSVFFTLFLLSFPYTFFLSFTYMSDVFYLSLLVISLFFYVKSLQDNKGNIALLAGVFTGLAFLERQIALILPTSFLLITLYRITVNRDISWKQTAYILIPFISIYLIYNQWIGSVEPPAAYVVNVAEPLKKEFLDRVMPWNLELTHATNSLYIEALAQRGIAYSNILMVFLLPLILIYKINIRRVMEEVSRNCGLILLISAGWVTLFITDIAYKTKFSQSGASYITNYDKLFNMNGIYPWLFWISLPVWIVILASVIKHYYLIFLKPRQKPLHKTFKILILFLILIITTIIFKTLSLVIPQTFSYHPQIADQNFLSNLIYTLEVIFASTGPSQVFGDLWFFYLFIFSLAGLLIFTITHYKFRQLNSQKLVFLFLGASFGFTLFTILFAAHFYWEQYILQILPFILIGFAYFFRTLKINYIRAGIVISLLLFFSLSITRSRYQIQGAMWELGTQIVETGVNPDRISAVSWAWQPYWFFESSFDEAVKNSNLAKDDTYRRGKQYWYRPVPKGENYDLKQVAANYSNISDNEKQIILETKPFWVFWQNYKIIAIKYNN